MIDHMNRTMHKHIVTIEDPIEFLHRDRNSIINQREVGQDTASFKRALRRVLRQDPDVILVGEMRDEETVHTALSRGRDRPPRALDAAHGRRLGDDQPHHRLLPAAPAAAGPRDDRRHAEGHRLPAPRPDRRTATAASRCCEIMVMTGRVHDMILDPKLTGQLPEVIAEGGYYGMQTFDQHLLQHLQAGRITMEDGVRTASSPHDFKLMVAAQSRSGARSRPAGRGPAARGRAAHGPPSAAPRPPRRRVATGRARRRPRPRCRRPHRRRRRPPPPRRRRASPVGAGAALLTGLPLGQGDGARSTPKDPPSADHARSVQRDRSRRMPSRSRTPSC